MEFDVTIQGAPYHLTILAKDSVLVSGKQGDYILYKRKDWHCADDINDSLLQSLGNAIDRHMQANP